MLGRVQSPDVLGGSLAVGDFLVGNIMVRVGYWLIRWLKRTRSNVKGNIVVFG